MAVTVTDRLIEFTAAADEFTEPLNIKAIRWVSKSALAGDDLSITESSAGDVTQVLFSSVAAGANYVEQAWFGDRGQFFPRGIEVDVLDSGTVYVYLA